MEEFNDALRTSSTSALVELFRVIDPALPEAMARAGVSGPPRTEFYEVVERVDY